VSCGAGGPPRRHEIAAVPIFSRFGLERPDERPLAFGDDVLPEIALGDYRTAAAGWGRAVQVYAQVPANAVLFSYAAFDPPEGGAWITAMAALSGGGAAGPCRVFTANQIAEPALAPGGTVIIATRYDNREPAPGLVTRLGHAGPGFYGELLVAVLPRPLWWQGTALVIASAAINQLMDVSLALELPFQGAKRVT
jgi:hypothetical protein